MEGQQAPQFSLKDAEGKEISLNEFKGQWVVLYFYPRDNTPGCTIEAMDFTRLAQGFKKHNAAVIGISRDSCASHQKFINDKKLTIMLLSDTDATVQKKYGVWRLKKFMGNESLGTVRSTFLIDPTGKIAQIWDHVSPDGHAQAVLNALTERKT